MAEEERAAQFREDQAARCRAKCERLSALAGSTSARTALGLAWHPFYLAMLEWRDVDPEPLCLCPVEPYDPDLLIA